MKDKILVIGLDGVDPDLLDKFIKEDILPNFKRIISNGVYGRIKSSIPIITTVTWTSFITGKNPGKHGIYGFVKFKKNSYDLKILNSSDRKTEGIWQILNRYNKTVGIFNLPSLYPPEKIDRFMVCGMLTPNKNCRFIYPPELQNEFLKEIKEYEIDVGATKSAYKNKDILLKAMFFLTDKRFEATRFLLKRYPCDVFITVVAETDRIQHYFLNDANSLRKYFKYLDDKLGDLLEGIDKETTIFILSDHGIGEFKKLMYINKWLIQHDLLKINKYSTNYLKHSFARKIIPMISNFLLWLGFDVEKIKLFLSERLINKIISLHCYYGGIEWTKTYAYFCSGAGEGIIINTKRRFPDGIVDDKDYESLRDRIIKDLLEFKDPDTGKRVIEAAYKREKLFSGDYIEDAPDIILKLYDGYYTNESTEVENVLQEPPRDEMLVADHRLEGIFIAYGRDVLPGIKINECSILDIAPTLFRKLGIAIPGDFDGRPLDEIFEPKSLAISKTISFSEAELLRKRIKELKLTGKIK